MSGKDRTGPNSGALRVYTAYEVDKFRIESFCWDEPIYLPIYL